LDEDCGYLITVRYRLWAVFTPCVLEQNTKL